MAIRKSVQCPTTIISESSFCPWRTTEETTLEATNGAKLDACCDSMSYLRRSLYVTLVLSAQATKPTDATMIAVWKRNAPILHAHCKRRNGRLSQNTLNVSRWMFTGNKGNSCQSKLAFISPFSPDYTRQQWMAAGIGSRNSVPFTRRSLSQSADNRPMPEAHRSKSPKQKKKSSKRHDKQRSDGDDDKMTKLEEENLRIEEETLAWVQRVVVGLNLCPFAAKPLNEHQLYITVIRGEDVEEILKNILSQCLVFTEEAFPGTALLVCPDLAPNDFHTYLDVLSMITEGLLEDYEMDGKVQVVGFHPLFEFAVEDEEDNDNETKESKKDRIEFWTNRSPYPMFHILQEEDVTNAITIMKGATDRVWQRNVQLLQNLEERGPDPDIVRQYLIGRQGADANGEMKQVVEKVLEEMKQQFPLLSRPVSKHDGKLS